MPRYPGAIWKPVGNFGYPRGTHGQLQPVAIVNHIAAGTLSGVDGWFANPASEASSHFCIGKLGQVHQYVDIADASWANGDVQKPDLAIPWLAECVQRNINPNLKTITIEHEGQTGEAWTEAMYASDLALHRWLITTFNIPVDDDHIIGHYRIDSVNRARCPGTGWPRTRLFADLKEDEMTDDEILAALKRLQGAGKLHEPVGKVFYALTADPPAGQELPLNHFRRILSTQTGLKDDIKASHGPHGGGTSAPHKHPLSATISGETGEA